MTNGIFVSPDFRIRCAATHAGFWRRYAPTQGLPPRRAVEMHISVGNFEFPLPTGWQMDLAIARCEGEMQYANELHHALSVGLRGGASPEDVPWFDVRFLFGVRYMKHPTGPFAGASHQMEGDKEVDGAKEAPVGKENGAEDPAEAPGEGPGEEAPMDVVQSREAPAVADPPSEGRGSSAVASPAVGPLLTRDDAVIVPRPQIAPKANRSPRSRIRRLPGRRFPVCKTVGSVDEREARSAKEAPKEGAGNVSSEGGAPGEPRGMKAPELPAETPSPPQAPPRSVEMVRFDEAVASSDLAAKLGAVGSSVPTTVAGMAFELANLAEEVRELKKRATPARPPSPPHKRPWWTETAAQRYAAARLPSCEALAAQRRHNCHKNVFGPPIDVDALGPEDLGDDPAEDAASREGPEETDK